MYRPPANKYRNRMLSSSTYASNSSLNSFSPGQPVLSQSFHYNIALLDFFTREWIDVEDLQKHVANFHLPQKLLDNAKEAGITELTSCQSLLMTQYFKHKGQADYIIHVPHLSGLSTAVAICTIPHIMEYKEYDRTYPNRLSPMVVVLCEDDNAVNRSARIFSDMARETGVNVGKLHRKTWRANLDKCTNCDIIVLTPFTMAEIEERINRSRILFIFVDWADKVFKDFELSSTRNLVRYLGSANNAVRILGCEHIYESRRVFYGESCRDNVLELRIEEPPKE